MPFEKIQDNIKAWRDPSEKEVAEFQDKLLNPVRDKTDISELPSSIQSKLDRFVTDNLAGTRLLYNANSTVSKSLRSLVNKNPQLNAVDIILPVYGGLHVLKPCLESVKNRTVWPYRLIVVDDCSPDEKTKSWLKEWGQDNPEHFVLFNKKNRGFAATVNRGITYGTNPYICVLNSDVLVTQNWLTKLILALEADEKNKIVNPVTNNTAVINVPIQSGASYLDMNRAIERLSARRYPEIMPTGFCFMFHRKLIDDIGEFDEAYGSYGEETDLWMRAITHVKEGGEYAQWRAVLADDTYLFHERGSSFNILGEDEHMGIRKSGSSRFHQIWPAFRSWQKSFDVDGALGSLRREIPETILENSESPYNVAFVVYSTEYCGAMRYIADIVNELNERNVNAKVVRIQRQPNSSKKVLSELRSAPVHFDSITDFVQSFGDRVFNKGVVIAATAELANIVSAVCKYKSGLKPALFAQSDDIAISPTPEVAESMEKAIKEIKNVISGSDLLESKMKKLGVNSLGAVKPGVDTDIFYERNRELGDDRPTVLFSLRPGYPFRGLERGIHTAQELWRLARRHKKEIRILAYGATSVSNAPYIICLGQLTQSRLAHVLGTEVDIFCDPSHVHSYGLPSIEAMRSGAVPVCWDNGGINEYANNDTAIINPSSASPNVVANKIFNLLFDEETLKKKKKYCLQINQTRKEGVNKFISLLEKGFKLKGDSKKISIITPHLRKHGGPTTILHTANELSSKGHDVSIHTIYTDINPEVVKISKVPINLNWKRLPDSDVLITNSDNPYNEHFSQMKNVKKKILLKLSHNERFKELEEKSLQLDWDSIVTSTNWLKEACEHPLEGWNHPPKKAERVGWFHYGHELFNCPPEGKQEGPVLFIGTLVHHHPLKGTNEAIRALTSIKRNFGDKVGIVGVGEWQDFVQQRPPWMQYYYNPNRQQMADYMKKINIWVSASHTEGLGRLALEAMSSSCSCVLTDTNAEFAKDNENCILVPNNNMESLVAGITSLLVDQDLRKRIAKEGYKTAKEYADISDYSNNLERIIEGLFHD